ncbi:MAG TPA: Calx-beta domain-containing protein, partial [Propionibacteriaceae bacterium]|nr:Calx-beta domain-containing protein [Propionibacteriaceae bacterium]
MSGYYTITPTTLVFAPGETRKIVTASVSGADTNDEGNDNYPLRLESPVGGSLADDTADGLILNDDGPLYAVTDARVVEGTGGGPRYLAFTVTRSVTGPFAGMVGFRTVAGTATEFEDYVPKSGVIAFPVGLQSASVRVPVLPDAVIEADETLFLRLSLVKDRYESRGTVFDGEGVGTIVSDDGLLLSIGDRTGGEGDVGTTPLSFTVTLSAASASPVAVDWETADGSATAPLDFAAASGTLVFGPGETTRTITVQILGDTGEEPFETLFVNLSNPTGGASIARGQGQGTITNTDGATDRSRLMFHNFVTNRLYRWHMKNGNTLDTYNWVTPWATDAGWTVGAVADFDQDGQLDYLWHNVNDGRLLFWYIDGDNLKGYQFLPYLAEPPWRVATTFDGNGDGAADLVYYNPSTGAVRVTLHDNATVTGSYDLLTNLPGAGSARIVAAGDANNDGDDELILYDSATGGVFAWDVLGPNLQATT